VSSEARSTNKALQSKPPIWVGDELDSVKLADGRLTKRLKVLLGQMGDKPGASIPFACQDWANTKAAYRFLSNKRVDESQIMQGHFLATQSRFEGHCQTEDDPYVLILHDTTEVSYRREDPSRVGLIGKLDQYTQCGVLLHSSLAVTTEGLPLGLAASRFWTRQEFKGTNALRRLVNPTRIPIHTKESYRWIENVRQSTQLFNHPQRCLHIGDRESDIYELFCEAKALNTHFLVRTCVNRLAGVKGKTLNDYMGQLTCQGTHRVQVLNRFGKPEWATLELTYQRLTVHPPIGKQKDYPDLELTVLHAREVDPPSGRAPIYWKLMTDLTVTNQHEAVEKLQWYALRWKIEVFHKVLKSGCKVEASKLRTAHGLSNLIALYCILAWRIFWLTMLNRSMPDESATIVFTDAEQRALDYYTKNRASQTLSSYALKLARLGGYLARKQDPPPGNQITWRALQRLNDIVLGMELARENCG
jgi:hypothetical protein